MEFFFQKNECQTVPAILFHVFHAWRASFDFKNNTTKTATCVSMLIFKMPFLIPNSGSAIFTVRDDIHRAAAAPGMTAGLVTVRYRSRRKLTCGGAASANLSSATCAGRTPSCAAPGPASSSAAVLPPPAPAPCSPGPGCCPPAAGASPLKHKQAERARLVSSRTPPPGTRPMKDSTSHLRVLLVVQRLSVRVVFANQRIHQQQEEHVEQQSANHRQVDDDGDLGRAGGGDQIYCQTFSRWKCAGNGEWKHLDGVATPFLVLALAQQAVSLDVVAGHRHGLHYMETVAGKKPKTLCVTQNVLNQSLFNCQFERLQSNSNTLTKIPVEWTKWSTLFLCAWR